MSRALRGLLFVAARGGILMVKLVAMLSVCSLANASILFERDLPVSGLNLSGASRSNIAPIQGSISGTPFVLGDNFTLAGTGFYRVDSITVWIVGNCPVTTCTPTNATPNSEFSSISLFGGLDSSGHVNLLSSSYSSTHVQYTGGVDYLSGTGSGLSYPLFQITFPSLNLILQGSQLFDFAVQGTPNSISAFLLPPPPGPLDTRGAGSLPSFALHASTAGISGGIQQGADNFIILYEGNPLTPTFAAGAGNLANFANGADVNVLVDGVSIAIPEPGVIGMCSLGLGILALAYRLRA